MGRTHDEGVVTDGEIALTKAMLLASGHTDYEADWMARSCPSMTRARAVCSEDRRRIIMRATKPSPEAIAIKNAHDEVRKGIGTPREEAARANLETIVRDIAARVNARSAERKPE